MAVINPHEATKTTGGVDTGDHDGDEQYGGGRGSEDPSGWRGGSTGPGAGGPSVGGGETEEAAQEDPSGWRGGSTGPGAGGPSVASGGTDKAAQEDPSGWRGGGTGPGAGGPSVGGGIGSESGKEIETDTDNRGNGINADPNPRGSGSKQNTGSSDKGGASELDLFDVESEEVDTITGDQSGGTADGDVDADKPKTRGEGTHTLDDGSVLVVSIDSNGNRIEHLYPADYRYEEGYHTGRSILTVTRPDGSTTTHYQDGGEFISEQKFGGLAPPERVFEDIILVDLAKVDETAANWAEQASLYRNLATHYESDDRTNEFEVVDKETGETVPVTEWLHRRIEQAESSHAEEKADNAAFYKSYLLATAPLEGDQRPLSELVQDIDATVENMNALLAMTEGQPRRDFITGEIARLETEAEFRADLKRVEDGEAPIQTVLSKWEADPRGDDVMLQAPGELLHGEEVGDYSGPPSEISAVDWLREAAAEDTAWQERRESRQNEQALAFAEFQADMQGVADGEATIQAVLSKWEADPRGDDVMLQMPGELLHGEEVGDYSGPSSETSAVEWLRQAVAEDTAWQERIESHQNEQALTFSEFQDDMKQVEDGKARIQTVLSKWEADPRGADLNLQVPGELLHGEEVGYYSGPSSEISAVEWLRQAVAGDNAWRERNQSSPAYNRMLVMEESGSFDPALGITSDGRFNAGLATPVGIGDMQAAANRIAYWEWLALRDAPEMELGPYQGPAPTTDSYSGRYSPWLDADGNQVLTEAEATYRIDGAGSDAVIVGIRPRREVDDSEPGPIDSAANAVLKGLQAPNPGAAQKADQLAGQMQYGPHHGKHPSEVLGPSDHLQAQVEWASVNLVDRKIDRFGNIQYAADLDGPYKNSATPIENVMGVNDDGSLKLADPSQVVALHASNAKIDGINPDGTTDLGGGSVGRWAERAGSVLPGFGTLYDVSLAYDPASPDGSRWSTDEKIGIAKNSALDSLYVSGWPFGAVNIARNIATGGGRALLTNPGKNIIRPLFWNSSLPMTSRQIAGQVGNLGRSAYQGGNWLMRGATGQGFTVAPGIRGVAGNKLVNMGRGIRSEAGEELVETPFEVGVTWGLTGTPEFNSPFAVAGNILTFGSLDAANPGLRRTGSSPGQTYEYDLAQVSGYVPTGPDGTPSRRFYKTPNGLYVPMIAGGSDSPESSTADADPSDGFDYSDRLARLDAVSQHDNGVANGYRSGLMSVTPQVAPEWNPLDPYGAAGASKPLTMASPPVLTPYEGTAGFTETSPRTAPPPQKPPAPPRVDDPGSSGRNPGPPPAPPPQTLSPLYTPAHSPTPSPFDQPLTDSFVPTITSPYFSQMPNIETPFQTITPRSPTSQPFSIFTPSIWETPVTSPTVTPTETLESPAEATATLESPGTATATATAAATAPTPSPSEVAGTTPGLAPTPIPVQEPQPPPATPTPTDTPTDTPTPTPTPTPNDRGGPSEQEDTVSPHIVRWKSENENLLDLRTGEHKVIPVSDIHMETFGVVQVGPGKPLPEVSAGALRVISTGEYALPQYRTRSNRAGNFSVKQPGGKAKRKATRHPYLDGRDGVRRRRRRR